MSPGFERIGSETAFDGKLATVRIEEYRYDDGGTATREVVEHPGAVAIVAHDGTDLLLVSQPREAVGEHDLLELPAGTLDVEGESQLDCAKRELAEEVGVGAAEWEELKRFYTTPGFAREEVTLFLATGLHPAEAEADPGERIEIVRRPLTELDATIRECRDSKSIIGMMLLRARL